ncbi:hypothetical protein [Salinigranum sp.]|uniref:hypothetical protein n=1 Tax=Salinigranum sp. TaxID=1966351 RepID=UPI00356AEFF9
MPLGRRRDEGVEHLLGDGDPVRVDASREEARVAVAGPTAEFQDGTVGVATGVHEEGSVRSAGSEASWNRAHGSNGDSDTSTTVVTDNIETLTSRLSDMDIGRIVSTEYETVDADTRVAKLTAKFDESGDRAFVVDDDSEYLESPPSGN